MWQWKFDARAQHPKEELISAMADGKLELGETHRIAEHLRDCEQCRNLLADFERNKMLFRSMEKPETPGQQFWDDTFRKMRASTAPEPRAVDRSARSRRQWQAAFAAAACFATAAIIVPLSTHTNSAQDAAYNAGAASAPEDSIDAADVSTFVRAHTESVAYQPLSDPDRQQMIAAEADGMPSGDQTPEAAGNADVSP